MDLLVPVHIKVRSYNIIGIESYKLVHQQVQIPKLSTTKLVNYIEKNIKHHFTFLASKVMPHLIYYKIVKIGFVMPNIVMIPYNVVKYV